MHFALFHLRVEFSSLWADEGPPCTCPLCASDWSSCVPHSEGLQLSRDLGATYLELPSLNHVFVGRYFGSVVSEDIKQESNHQNRNLTTSVHRVRFICDIFQPLWLNKHLIAFVALCASCNTMFSTFYTIPMNARRWTLHFEIGTVLNGGNKQVAMLLFSRLFPKRITDDVTTLFLYLVFERTCVFLYCSAGVLHDSVSETQSQRKTREEARK